MKNNKYWNIFIKKNSLTKDNKISFDNNKEYIFLNLFDINSFNITLLFSFLMISSIFFSQYN